jgi:hypothetical protein
MCGRLPDSSRVQGAWFGQLLQAWSYFLQS